MRVPLLALLFLVVPIAELAVIVTVASQIGVLETIAALILISVVGAWLVKREGLAVFRRVQAQLREGRLPHKELIDGFLVMFAGALLLTPGFLTDLLAVLLLLPPTRAVVRGVVLESFRKRTAVFRVVSRVPGDARSSVRRSDGKGVYDVSGTESPRPPRGPAPGPNPPELGPR